MSFQVRMSGPDLKAAYNAVRDGDPDTEWALYTYLNNGGDLVVQETGAGGLETLCTKFSPIRVQHAFARVEDPRMHGDKFILIHWCGDDAPAGPRRFFAINSGVISSLLKGAQVTFTASDEHDIAPEAIMKRLIGQGTASEVPRAPAKSLFRRATDSYRAPQRLNSSYVPEKPAVSALRPTARAKFSEPVPETTYSHVLTEEPQEMGDPFGDPTHSRGRTPEPVRPAPEPVRRAPEPVQRAPEPIRRTPEPLRASPEPLRRTPEPLQRTPEPPQRTPEPPQRTPPPVTTTTAPPAPRPAINRGMTWGERLAARRRLDTVDEERQHSMYDTGGRLNTVSGDASSTLSWSQRQALAKQKAEEEERAKEAARLAELEFQENERKLRELEERVEAEKAALQAELQRQEEEERRHQEEEERWRWEQQMRQEEMERKMEEERQKKEIERQEEELRRFEQIKAERKRQEELARQLDRERQERERNESLARRLEQERQEEARKRLEETERLSARVQQMEALRAEAEAKEKALLAEAARRDREAEERIKLMELRIRQAEEERLAAIRAKEEDEAALLEELHQKDLQDREERERLERDRKLQEERLLAEKRETDAIRSAEIQRLMQRVRELELRRESGAIEERAAKLRQEQERNKRIELEKIAERERQEKERLLAKEREEEARRMEEEEDRMREFEELHNRVMEMERLAMQEGSARDKAAAAEKEIRQRLRQAEERAARLLAEKEAMLRRQQEEQAKIRAAAKELARRREEEADAQVSAPESQSTAVDLNVEGSPSGEKRRVALPKRQPNGWNPLQSGGGFSFERAARTLVRMNGDSPREPAPYLKNAAQDLSSFFVVDYGVKPQSDFVIQLPRH